MTLVLDETGTCLGEHEDNLMGLQRGKVGVEKPSGVVLSPDNLVLQHTKIAASENGCERHLGEQDYGSVVLDDTVVLFPESVKGDCAIPVVASGAIREVANDSVDALVGNIEHPDKAVLIVYLVELHHFCLMSFIFPNAYKMPQLRAVYRL